MKIKDIQEDTKKNEIWKWLEGTVTNFHLHKREIAINDDYSISAIINNNINLESVIQKAGEIPDFIKFKEVFNFYLYDMELTDLQIIPERFNALVFGKGSVMPALSGISKVVKHGEIIRLNETLKGPALDLLRIDGLTKIGFNAKYEKGAEKKFPKQKQDVLKAIDILNKHIEGDIFECQEELIEAGLEEFAQL